MERKVKQEIRERIWRLMEEKNVASFPRPVRGRIPNFKGSAQAAKILSETQEFRDARVIKSNPDSPQAPLRELVLRARKTLVVPTPRLRGEFFLMTEKAWDNPREASKIVNFSSFGERVHFKDIPKIDLIVVGSVAVSPEGSRVGKGEGYSELEYAILREQGFVDDKVPVVTTVHSIQVVDHIPVEPFDVPVDMFATEKDLFRTNPRPKPQGLLLEYLTPEKVLDTPYLQEYLKETGRLNRVLGRI
ncbi:hypothetical protein L3N51_02230 [Metallosphaera sp. J1]|uniref:5-formyltetrahydrofolate cyclo-ligase n=1 Tax=Metallosphaera javensis (ex Hofmann et al. 2022) TaxID=99938 RepID=UPI001EE0CED4|nr:5-formyltetrahydrofolate cyclo-ligase [Metallosphaera javensis (ex Hofmann et al. 2022)]MCG3109933.1 hypothetical protein [Metallosphaera javensis (ex Hofmann et al. 2022)]